MRHSIRMSADDDHADLRAVWTRLNSRLRDLRQSLDFGDDTFHVDISEKANRAADLALHLDAALAVVDRHLYGPAFSILRSSMEHAVLDWLLFLGHTYAQHIPDVTEADWAQWQVDRDAGASWTAHIVDWHRTSKGDVTIRRGGLFSEPDEQGKQEQISIYYFLLEQYDGLIGRPADQQGDGVLTGDEMRALASQNQDRWHDYLRWSALLENLVANDLISKVDCQRLGVHYRFLSTFAHPVSNTQRRLYGRQLDGREPHYDHYASELALLYVITFAALELENYRDGVRKALGVDLPDAQETDRDLRAARNVTNYFWFIGTNPNGWDFHAQANRLAIQRMRDGNIGEVGAQEPADAPFPTDPLLRLIQQHRNSHGRVEGMEFVSPWPRNDASRR